MANKSLSQVIGAGAREIGDIIRTEATALTDGKVLLPCDGSVINAGTYPLLAAMFDPGISLSEPEIEYAADGTTLSGNLFAPPGTLVMANGTTIGYVDYDVWLQDAADSGEVNTGSGGKSGFPAMSADANEVICPYIGTASASDIYIDYTITGGDPLANLLIASAGAWAVSEPYGLINQAGNLAKVIAFESGGSTIDTWTNGGVDLSAGWTETSSIAWSTSSPAAKGAHQYDYSDDLQDIAIPSTAGLLLSNDGGTTWTQDVQVPSGNDVKAVAVDELGNIYACCATDGRIYKTANLGTAWTTILTAVDALRLIQSDNNPSISQLVFSSVRCDLSGHLYVMAAAWPTSALSNTFMKSVVFYSEDAGVTWTATWREMSTNPLPKYLNLFESFQFIEKDGSNMGWYFEQSVNYELYKMTITKGKILPWMPGHKIVADAP